jgi:hypothetical protein
MAAYRDTFKLLLRFVTETTTHSAATLQVEDLNAGSHSAISHRAQNNAVQYDPDAQCPSCSDS